MVYGYVRVSTDKQTTENQRFEIEKFTKSRNMRIDRWVDETISGTKVIADRQLGKLLKQIRKGDILITTERHVSDVILASYELPSSMYGKRHHCIYGKGRLRTRK